MTPPTTRHKERGIFTTRLKKEAVYICDDHGSYSKSQNVMIISKYHCRYVLQLGGVMLGVLYLGGVMTRFHPSYSRILIKEHCFNISRDILYSVFHHFKLQTVWIAISLKQKEIFQKEKVHSVFWKAFQISTNGIRSRHRHFNVQLLTMNFVIRLLKSAIALWIHSCSDNVMTKFLINYVVF